MKNENLIDLLREFPSDADIRLSDGPRTMNVLSVYSKEARPVGAGKLGDPQAKEVWIDIG